MRCIRLALLVAVLAAAPAYGHDHGGFSVGTSGPRLGLSADQVLSAKGAPKEQPSRLEVVFQDAMRGAQPALGAGPAGGRAVVHRGGKLLSGVRAVPTAAQYTTENDAAEPTLAVSKNGTIFFVGIKGAGSVLLRSTDGGATFEDAGLTIQGAPNSATLDPFIYLDKTTDRLFNVDFVPPCSPVVHTDDLGETYEAGTVCNHTDHQNLFTGPPKSSEPIDYPNVVYYCSIDGGLLFAFGTFTACSKSIDGGLTFVRTGTVPFTDDPTQEGGSQGVKGHCGGAVGHGAVGPDGTVYLPRGWCGQPYVAVSEDEGVSWQKVQVSDIGMAVGPGQEEHEMNAAVDADGNVYVTWIARNRLPHLSISRDKGKTWSKPMMVAPPGVNEAFYAGVDVGAPGRVAINYYGTTNGPGGPFCVKTTGPDACETADGGSGPASEAYEKATWNGYLTMSVNVLDAQPTFMSATVNDPADPLIRTTCGPNRCGQTHDFFDVVVAADGTPYASYIDACSAEPEDPCALGVGIVGRLVGGPPLFGTIADQQPTVAPAPALPPAPATPGAPCAKRSFTIRVRKPKRGRLTKVSLTANGKRIKVRRKRGRYSAVLRIAAGPPRVVVVRIKTQTSTGRRAKFVRRYRNCR
jgi:hypothetical protein